MASVPIRFGVFEVDVDARELRKNGVRIKLEQQPFAVLLLLLERPGAVVTREELRSHLWPNGVHVDFDRSLNKAIGKLRLTLGDLAESPRFIETKSRHGYRFIAPVERDGTFNHDQPREKQVADSVPVVTSRESRARVWKIACVVTVAALVAGTILSRLVLRQPSSPQINAIAVLPLRNLSGDPDRDYLAAGLTEMLTTEIAQMGTFDVIAPTSMLRYQSHGKTARQIARGSTSTHLWKDRYNAPAIVS